MISSVKNWFTRSNSNNNAVREHVDEEKKRQQPRARYVLVRVNSSKRECALQPSEKERLIKIMKKHGVELSLRHSSKTLDRSIKGCLPVDGKNLLRELARFLYMAAQRPDIVYLLPREVDAAWLAFVNDTEMYSTYCHDCFGRMSHHPHPAEIEYLKAGNRNQLLPWTERDRPPSEDLTDTNDAEVYALYVDLLDKSVEVFGKYPESMWLGVRLDGDE